MAVILENVCNIVPEKSLHFRIKLELVFFNVVSEEATVRSTTH